MIKDARELLGTGHELWPNWTEAPRLLRNIQDMISRAPSSDRGITRLALEGMLGIRLPYQPEPQVTVKRRRILGQLLLGEMAERRFEELYTNTIHSSEFRLEDVRRGRGDTDYRLFNGRNRPVFRLNIKVRGTLFERAQELVGLHPQDCFALATYKIWKALKDQEQEKLPYVFVVVAADISAEQTGKCIPDAFVEMTCLAASVGARLGGVRRVEEQVVRVVLASQSEEVKRIQTRMARSPWYVLSARRAGRLLTDKLFERVYALRVRSFARNYGKAEVDMHYSLTDDMTPFDAFLRRLQERGLHGISVELERGDM